MLPAHLHTLTCCSGVAKTAADRLRDEQVTWKREGTEERAGLRRDKEKENI